MTLDEAYDILDARSDVNDELLKANYRWLVRFYHPDTKLGNNSLEFNRVLEAYALVKGHRERYGT